MTTTAESNEARDRLPRYLADVFGAQPIEEKAL